MQFPFTKDELEGLTKSNLLKVAKYYKIKGVSKGLSKVALIEAIWEDTYKKPKEEEQREIVEELVRTGELPPMSVRVRRLYEQNILKLE